MFCDAEQRWTGDKICFCPRLGRHMICACDQRTACFPLMTTASTPKSRRSTLAEPDATPIAPSYEAALEELERLVSQLDAGQLPLDQLLVHYQRGSELLAFCRQFGEQAITP